MSLVFNFVKMAKFTDSIFPWYFRSRKAFIFNRKRLIADLKFYIVLFRIVPEVAAAAAAVVVVVSLSLSICNYLTSGLP